MADELGVLLYCFESEASDSESHGGKVDSSESSLERIGNTDW